MVPFKFSHYRLTNNICLNPVWNLGYTVKSYLNEKNKPSDINITLNESINILKQNKIINSNKIIDNNRPILNETSSPIPRNDYNIIIILMELYRSKYWLNHNHLIISAMNLINLQFL